MKRLLFILFLTSYFLLLTTSIGAQFQTKDCSLTSTRLISHIGKDLVPLYEMGVNDYYPDSSHSLRQEGGLYGGGSNNIPSAHYQKVVESTNAIVPRDVNGNPDSVNGKVCMVAIGMSNTRREFNVFISRADSDSEKSPRVQLVNTAQESMVASSWAKRSVPTQQNPDPWEGTRGFVERIASAGCSPAQVQAAWIKLTNANPDQPGREDFPIYSEEMYRDMTKVVTYLRQYSNVKVAYLSTRMYGGYSLIPLSPEPSVFESSFAMRWLIQDQMGDHQSNTSLATSVPYTDVTYDNAPTLVWGPYFWANGLVSRNGNDPLIGNLTWTCNDMVDDGVHPADSAKDKISGFLLSYFKTDPLAKSWFTGSGVVPTSSVTDTPTPTDSQNPPGDGDGDGDVDIDDYVIWINQYLNYSPLTNADPDFNNDNQVNGQDFVIWFNNY